MPPCDFCQLYLSPSRPLEITPPLLCLPEAIASAVSMGMGPVREQSKLATTKVSKAGRSSCGLEMGRARCLMLVGCLSCLVRAIESTEESTELSSDHPPPAGVKYSTSSWACWGAAGRVSRYPPPPNTPLSPIPPASFPTLCAR